MSDPMSSAVRPVPEHPGHGAPPSPRAWRALGAELTPRAMIGLTVTMLLSGALMLLLLSRLIGASQMVASVPPYPLIGHPAPDFTITLWSGSTPRQSSLHLADLKGKVVVLNFWASWCDTCSLEAPDLQRAYEHYRDQGVVFVGLAYDDTAEHGKPFLQKYGITYPSGPDPTGAYAVAYGVAGPPETIFIARDGKIASKAPGGVVRATLDANLKGLVT